MQNFDLDKLDGRSLKILLSIHDTGSVSAAADIFDLNQSTISHTLDKLRSAIGDPLFTKVGRGITPTEKMISIIPRVQEILAGIEGLVESEIYEVSKDLRPLSIAIPTPALVAEMKAITLDIRKRAPDLEFRIKRLAPRERITHVLESGEADVAVGVEEVPYSAVLNHSPYCADEWVVFYDPNTRGPIVSREDFANAAHAAAGFTGKTKSVVELALAEHGIQRRISLVAPTASMLGELIRETDLVATMPSKLANGVYRHLAHCPPPVPLPPIKYDLVWHRRNEHSGRNTWLRRLILDSTHD